MTNSAELVLGIFTPQCYDKIITNLDLTDMDCIVSSLSKFVGLAIVVLSFLLKVPQILKILSAKSVRGLSLATFLIELLIYTSAFSYGFRRYEFSYVHAAAHNYSEFPYSTYAENGIIGVQNVFIIGMFAAYNGMVGRFVVFLAGYAALVYALLSGAIPLSVLVLLQSFNIPINIASRLPQILTNQRSKSTGQLSVITWLLNFLGSFARIFTTLSELSDPIILVGYVIGATLNGIVLGQILYYGEGKPESTPRSKGKAPTPRRKTRKAD